ncbi:hypothetical protein BDR26DRAFT_868123 [Obelidium mucronatum]|nr:hypothetical protein BDR26DRAFT_868123 [Obelidium mucronatum]
MLISRFLYIFVFPSACFSAPWKFNLLEGVKQLASDIIVSIDEPLLPNANDLPIGSYICSGKKGSNILFQTGRHLVTNQVQWNVVQICLAGNICRVKFPDKIGCVRA